MRNFLLYFLNRILPQFRLRILVQITTFFLTLNIVHRYLVPMFSLKNTDQRIASISYAANYITNLSKIVEMSTTNAIQD
jgi:hypothetical protein